MSKKCIYFSSLLYSYMMFESVAIRFRCMFLRGTEGVLLRKSISNFAETHMKNGYGDVAVRYVTWRHVPKTMTSLLLLK